MNCYLCNGTDFSIRKGRVRDNPSLHVLECVKCGLVFLDSMQHIISGHYEDSGMHGNQVPTIDSWLRDTEHDDQRRYEMLEPIIVNAKILDFGSGAGGFLRKACALAAKVEGVEPEKRVRDYWEGTITLYSNLDDVGYEYDLITAFHVIEHLPEPHLMLKKMAERLNNTGRIVIEVPNSEDALLTLYDSIPFQNFTYWSQHLYLFNAETLHRLAKKAGLKVISIRQFQRYPLSNHLYWLSRDKPGGHKCWSFLNTSQLEEAYAASLAAEGRCDTLIAHLELGTI